MGRRARKAGGHKRDGGATTAYTYGAGDRPTQITESVGGTITRTYDNRFDTADSALPGSVPGSDPRNHLISRNNALRHPWFIGLELGVCRTWDDSAATVGERDRKSVV